MKVHTTEQALTPGPQFQAVIAVIEFVPWPFYDQTIRTTIPLIDSDGSLQPSEDGDVWMLENRGDNLIVVFEDGSQAVANRYGIEKYMDNWGGVSVPWLS